MPLATAQSAASGEALAINSATLAESHASSAHNRLDFMNEEGWRVFLSGIGIDSAVLSCQFRAGELRRQLYFIGLDQLRGERDLSAALGAYAERVWEAQPRCSFRTYRLARPAPEELRLPFQRGRLVGLLADYEHAAVALHQSARASISGLFLRRVESGPFPPDMERQLREALPLIEEAAHSRAQSSQHALQAALLSAMFDQVSPATFLVDAQSRPLFMNQSGRELLATRELLVQGADGAIAARDQAQNRELRAAIRAVTTSERDATEQISFRIGEPDCDWRLAVVVPASTMAGDQHIRGAMLLLHAPQLASAPGHMLKALGLLPSEQRFLDAFLRTSSLAEAAQQSGLSDETAKTYLKRVRAKLGVHRQLELARLIYGLVPPVGRPLSHAAQ